jgi:hypothetical protein
VNPYVVLVEGHGYVQEHRHDRLGPLATARAYPHRDAAIKGALGFLRRKGKDGWTAEAVTDPRPPVAS